MRAPGRAWIAALLLLAACGAEEVESAPVPAPVPAPAASSRVGEAPPGSLPAGRGPAGEVPAHSRRPHDGTAPAPVRPEDAEFDLGVPGLPGAAFHYHLRVRADGTARALVSGSAGAAPFRVVLLRVKEAPSSAVRARDAVAGAAASVEILDPASSGGCGGGDAHAAPGSLRVPAAWLVRVPLPRDARAGAAAAAAKAAGGTVALETDIGGAEGDRIRLDLVLVE